MFGINWPELLVIGVVAVLVIGPKDLPPLMRQIGRWARKARLMYDDMRQHWDDLPNQIDLAEMEKQADKLQKKTNAPFLGDAEPPVPEPEAMGSDDNLAPDSPKPKARV